MAITEMAIVDESDEAIFEAPSYVQWGPVIVGAAAAAAFAFVLHGFAAAIGLSVSSTAPTWRDSSMALTLLAGIYLLFAAILAYGLGGYISGRAASVFIAAADIATADREETEFRDGTNGLVSWALATLLTGLIAFGAAQAGARLSAPAAQPTSTAAENIIAFDLDRLFRSEQRSDGT
jgi:hypothetical protein